MVSNEASLPADTSITGMTDDEFRRHLVAANETYTAAADTASTAARVHATALIEQIARHLTTIRPTAEWMSIAVRQTYHLNPDGTRNPHCEGHNPVMVARRVLAPNHTTLDNLTDLDPIHFWLERLSEVIDPQPMVLRVSTREFEMSYEADMDNAIDVHPLHHNAWFTNND